MDHEFSAAGYPPAFAEALGEATATPLGAGRSDPARREALEALAERAAFEIEASRPIVDRGMLDCCIGAAWLLHGYLDEAHRLFQDVPTATGSYWHGVVHRREGDFGNASYWFRRAGDHPVGPAIASAAAAHPETVEATLGGRWDPQRFNEQVQRAIRQGGALAEACEAVQLAEWQALFDFCWRRAVDG